MTYTQIVKKLIGKIHPVGETNQDHDSFVYLHTEGDFVLRPSLSAFYTDNLQDEVDSDEANEQGVVISSVSEGDF